MLISIKTTMKHTILTFLAASLLSSPTALLAQDNSSQSLFEKKDRVVFVGDGFIEREGEFGIIEQRLGHAFNKLNLSFRNIGWSGDTPKGLSRDHYTNPPTGYDHLLEQIDAAGAEVVIMGYGGHMAFDNAEPIDEFVEDYGKLLDDIDPEIKTILLSPPSHEGTEIVYSVRPPIDTYNARLSETALAIRKLAKSRGAHFVDLSSTTLMDFETSSEAMTLNGIHLNQLGYERIADLICLSLSCASNAHQLSMNMGAVKLTKSIKNGEAVELNIDGYKQGNLRLILNGLPEGNYELIENGQQLASAPSSIWSSGVDIDTRKTTRSMEKQRSLIVEKNDFYFKKYRPQNETYLVGFRRYEQGNNADELDLMDPLIMDLENAIARMNQARPSKFELRRIDG